MNTLEHPLFTIEHQGRIVTGRELRRTHRELVVQLVHPYGLLQSSLFMPSFMVQTGLSLDGELGDEKRCMLLRELYEHAVLFAALVPPLVRTIGPVGKRTCGGNPFMRHMNAALKDALRHHPRIAALPLLHPRRFHHCASWLRIHRSLPDVRFAPPGIDKELEWQFLLLLHHGAKGSYHRFEKIGNWEGN